MRAGLWDEVKDRLQRERTWGSRAASNNGCVSPAPWRSIRRMVLMDEPASALDPRCHVQKIEDLIDELRQEYLYYQLLLPITCSRPRRVSHVYGLLSTWGR